MFSVRNGFISIRNVVAEARHRVVTGVKFESHAKNQPAAAEPQVAKRRGIVVEYNPYMGRAYGTAVTTADVVVAEQPKAEPHANKEVKGTVNARQSFTSRFVNTAQKVFKATKWATLDTIFGSNVALYLDDVYRPAVTWGLDLRSWLIHFTKQTLLGSAVTLGLAAIAYVLLGLLILSGWVPFAYVGLIAAYLADFALMYTFANACSAGISLIATFIAFFIAEWNS